jgi:protein ImuB
MPERTLVVWCGDWPVVAAGVAPDQLAAVVFANRVVAATPAARAQGVQRGQRRREAQGRCPDVAVLERDEGREARAFEPVVQAVEAITPRVELTRPGSCAFATRGPSRYFGGDEALAALVAERVTTVLEPLGWGADRGAAPVRTGVADGPFAAALAARAAGGTIVAVGTTPSFLAPLPVGVLERPELTEVLIRLGITTLGGLASLPMADLVARFGREGQSAHRLASGLDECPLDTKAPSPELTVHHELDPPAERVDAAAFVAKMLADDLFGRLDARGMSCTRVLVSAETVHGEVSERLWRHEGALTASALADRVRWQIDGWLNGPVVSRPTSGISLLRLVPDEVTPAHGRQLGFWGGETASAERAARAVARVQGLLGPDAVRVPEWCGGRNPAEQVRLVPAHAVDLTAARPSTDPSWVMAPWPGRLPPPSPARLHDPPRSVEVLDGEGRPVQVSGRGVVSAAPVQVRLSGWERSVPAKSVTAWAGPWPVDERWWDPESHRRRARFQVVLDEGDAYLLSLEGGRWWLDATYD